MMGVFVQPAAFDAGDVLSKFQTHVQKVQGGAGAVVSFTGVVRDHGGSLKGMEIEHYPRMTETAIKAQIAMAIDRFGLIDALVIHRYGLLDPGAPIMMVATAAAHRKAAFAGADFLMDYLKSRAPFWKREIFTDGATWVAANPEDEQALARWGQM